MKYKRNNIKIIDKAIIYNITIYNYLEIII